MISFGIHPFIWTSTWNHDSAHLVKRSRELGFDAMDIPVRTLDARDLEVTRAALLEHGMRVVAVAGVCPPWDVSAEDPEARQAAVDYLKRLVRNAQGIGASLLAGVLYAPVGKFTGSAPQEAELERSAGSLREVARFAAEHGVALALEPINRYETYMINTVDQGLEMLERIGEPNVGLLLDTYQMNIEEKDFYWAMLRAGGRLFHLHACENDRGTPGSGLVRWEQVFAALREIRYRACISIESFACAIPETAATTRIWRSLAADGDTLAREGLAFLRSMAGSHGLLDG